ncbi:MAG: bifunctional DNA-formamidopyrimidine glycosylase/DNA-(apurinic or apyrimidinic site) lyase [Thermoleophilia bacterium]|nr:bifunctional DNA-formamidopyrimidine glycosylase/DNA-(apurinic or apyrimidinic site) lyase [Thermoleophilia bacterium]
MPELPEVETIRSRLAPVLTGRTLVRVEIADARLTRPELPEAVSAELTGETVEDVRRRGKYLVFAFRSGRHLLVHLRMTGSFEWASGDVPDRHRRALLTLDDGSRVAYRDIRRFGTWLLLEPGELDAYLAARIGGEPLEAAFTTGALARGLAGRRAPIKAALLDQRAVAGVGNIYADEALWRARIHPLRPAGELSRAEVAALRKAVRRALELGIERAGTTLRDYRDPDGRGGRMQLELQVYGRGGEACARCGGAIARTRAGGRTTWYCPSCQPLAPEERPPRGDATPRASRARPRGRAARAR